jgi:hypothetical protein
VLLSPRADVSVALGAVLLTARFGSEPRAVPVLEMPRASAKAIDAAAQAAALRHAPRAR